jgi:tRNA (guanine-N7-)-methyltransferase
VPLNEHSARINPYLRAVHDHPGVLLPTPSPAALDALRAAAGTPRRLVVDLGCGSGNFLLQLAAQRPQDHFVGLELRFKRLVKSARKFERLGLHNVWILREQAERFGSYFAPGAVAEVHVNFPDPWPRRSQWRKRLIQPAFLSELERLLTPGGWFFLKTDHTGYFLHVLGLIHRRPGWRLRDFCNDTHLRSAASRGVAAGGQQAAPAETEFEQLFRSKGQAVFSLALERTR